MPNKSKEDGPGRLTVDLSEHVREKIDRIREATHAERLVEVVRRSIDVYLYILDEKAAGRKVIITGSDGVDRELVVV